MSDRPTADNDATGVRPRLDRGRPPVPHHSADYDAPLYPRLRAAISNAYYDARNAGRTMEQAADAAAADCEEAVKAWLADHAARVIPPDRT